MNARATVVLRSGSRVVECPMCLTLIHFTAWEEPVEDAVERIRRGLGVHLRTACPGRRG